MNSACHTAPGLWDCGELLWGGVFLGWYLVEYMDVLGSERMLGDATGEGSFCVGSKKIKQ